MYSVKIFVSTANEILCYDEKLIYFLNHVMEASFTQWIHVQRGFGSKDWIMHGLNNKDFLSSKLIWLLLLLSAQSAEKQRLMLSNLPLEGSGWPPGGSLIVMVHFYHTTSSNLSSQEYTDILSQIFFPY